MRSVWIVLRPFAMTNWGAAVLAASSEPTTITPRATKLTAMMKFLASFRSSHSAISRRFPE
jgi:hypothetical protein